MVRQDHPSVGTRLLLAISTNGRVPRDCLRRCESISVSVIVTLAYSVSLSLPISVSLSVGTVGSVRSIGSIWAIRSVGAIGSVGSVGSVGAVGTSISTISGSAIRSKGSLIVVAGSIWSGGLIPLRDVDVLCILQVFDVFVHSHTAVR